MGIFVSLYATISDMTKTFFRCLPFVAALLALCATQAEAAPSVLVSTIRTTPIYTVDGPSYRKTDTDLSSETLLVKLQHLKDGDIEYCLARSIFPDRGMILVRSTDVVPFEDLTQSLAIRLTKQSKQKPLNQQEPPNNLFVPASIQTGGPFILAAWKKLQPVIELNENPKLVAERLPEPYFTRAQLWAKVQNYPAATKDYLLALKYAASTTGNIERYSKYRDQIIETIDAFSQTPAPPIGSTPNMAFSSLQHLSAGITYFRNNDYTAAVRSLNNSVSIKSNNPIAWYYLALAHRKSDDIEQANFAAIYATFLERNALNQRSIAKTINRSLERVQGPERRWLENFRLGDPKRHYTISIVPK